MQNTNFKILIERLFVSFENYFKIENNDKTFFSDQLGTEKANEIIEYISLMNNDNIFFDLINISNLLIGAVLGAILGVCLSQLINKWNLYRFCNKNLKPLLGSYKVTLKNGHEYKSVSNEMNIIKAKGKRIKLKNENMDEGEVVFQSENYGRGWYKTRGNNLYGFYEIIILPNQKIAALRKYTRDNDAKEKTFTSVETSFIWEKK